MNTPFVERDYYSNSNLNKGGPHEMSIDQVIDLTIGFALTSKFVDPNLVYSPNGTPLQFSDGETKIVKRSAEHK